ncbi:DNA phosphorothioation-dependent restriction protein DptG [Tuberibacillus sp. Marseille-P3662]|uniref:DNA phosphorothioation-dependent restriction protein DptG n=1 Tax=Tuberibacillus sp. Marseille-P3662 TaxID=1965358 RepID=UPI000A1CCFB1|nr:DNA phosphorothioation-dependent restriction protein DptG [Tuberibacillus sp. Marseille-P3662]
MTTGLLNIDELEKLLQKKHDTGKIGDILPFTTRRTKNIRGNFNEIAGELVRLINDVQLKKSQEAQLEEQLIQQLTDQVETTDSSASFDLKRFINEYLFNNENEIKPMHPHLFNYIKLNKTHQSEFTKYASFIYDALVGNDREIKEVFDNKHSDDLLTELVLEHLDGLEVRNKNQTTYSSLISPIAHYFKEDLEYLSRHRDYFLKTFSLLTHYYMFMYVCQLLFKFERFEAADYNYIDPFYFALEWETISKRRKAASDLEGFRVIKDNTQKLFVHIHTMSHLSYNSFNNENSFMNYRELLDLLEENGQRQQFFDELRVWIHKYCVWANVELKEEPKSLEDAFKNLHECLQQGMNKQACDKFGKNILDIGANEFLKNRGGGIGYVLNANHDFLLLLTAVCVKDQRIPLNKLFEEFNNRGLAFDLHSKKEIINLLDSLNIIDKKSDSGDAQYVKPIL